MKAMTNKIVYPGLIALLLCTNACTTKTFGQQNEVIYHIVLRSFFDSNGDFHGDLNGLKSKLDYLQDLGVTSILLLPLYESDFYHNYFAKDFKMIDPRYGTIDDYLSLVKEIHRRGMKIYMDMEMQYVDEDHPWYKNSYGNKKSAFSDYILYTDTANLHPETLIFGISELKSYSGVVKKIAVVNLYSPAVQEYTFNMFRYWMDPNQDGKFDDGVDGFRLDHMMDNLDAKGRLVNLFNRFWSPIFSKLRQINPSVRFIAEQADWNSFGTDYFQKAGVDMVFAFRLRNAIISFSKKNIVAMADSVFNHTPPGKNQVVFIENHDVPRFASEVNRSLLKEKAGAALNLLLGGIPSVYYGQELGMVGKGGFGKFGISDGNDIPQREAFEWYKADTGKGMALWYKNTGPWWDSTNIHPNDGISLEEERNNPLSLWSFYKQLLTLRKEKTALSIGVYHVILNNNDEVISFIRQDKNSVLLAAINLSEKNQDATMDFSKIEAHNKKLISLFGNAATVREKEMIRTKLSPYEVDIWEVK